MLIRLTELKLIALIYNLKQFSDNIIKSSNKWVKWI